ncbi:exodeoxyribonuclease VII small subunit [Burkholderiaceae bacterium FT117]|uniref:exodeoxyribonuclease VII small subunit n=1 Tax=Zeimonas sediminis TaxID=2944268 RepID=UPI002342C0B4|nr:exodeoxyribonuclease VII small subunit [Zeimonas sediminis]MCM5569975.1 exodeoxyribonuclease VII small subunit [Zeimonas sediminis]
MARTKSPEAGPDAADSAGGSQGVSPAAPDTPDRFESALTELEAIVQQMEGGSLSLEQSLAAYRRGAELVGAARKALADVEQQVRILEADVLKPFDAGQDDEA